MFKLLALGAIGYAGYKYYEKQRGEGSLSYAGGHIRDAGPDAMRDTPVRAWTPADQASDESFPASDPPSTY